MNKEEEREYWPRVIREIQKLSGMTIEQLAERIGLSEREISYLKAGRRPTGIVAVRIYEIRCHLHRDTLRTVVHSVGTM